MPTTKTDQKIPPSRPYSETLKEILSDPEVAALYLEESLEYGDMELFTEALKAVAEALGGIGRLAKKTKLNRETLYRTLSEAGNPRLDTLAKVLAAMGLRIRVVPVRSKSRKSKKRAGDSQEGFRSRRRAA
jgi:probable addiction module antidote protein